jgi:hypothetical protein
VISERQIYTNRPTAQGITKSTRQLFPARPTRHVGIRIARNKCGRISCAEPKHSDIISFFAKIHRPNDQGSPSFATHKTRSPGQPADAK